MLVYNGNTAGNAPGTKTAGQLYEERMAERKKLLAEDSHNVGSVTDAYARDAIVAIISILEKVN